MDKFSGVLCAFALLFAGCGAPVNTNQQPNPDSSPSPTDEPTPSPTPNPKASGSVSILTYNVHGLPAIITGDDTQGRMQLIGPLLNDFDVIGLQESFMDENHAILELESSHQTQVRFADILQGKVYGSGLAVFSETLEMEHQHEHYTDCNGVLDAGTDCLASKGFQVVRVELAPGIEVDLYNTHLDAGGGADDDAARETQVEQMLVSMAGYSAGRAVVFTGDTNLEYDDPNEGPLMEHFLTEGGLTDACLDVGCPEDDHIDRILLRSNDTVQLMVDGWFNEPAFFDQNGTPMSDHPAISIILSWEEL